MNDSIRFSKVYSQKEHTCKLCLKENSNKIWQGFAGADGSGAWVDCICKNELLLEKFLDGFPIGNKAPFKSEFFRKNNPGKQDLFIVGPLDNTWALLRGELGPQYKTLKFKCLESRDVSKSCVNGDDSIEWGELMSQDLIIVILVAASSSEHVNAHYRQLKQGCEISNVRVWFVVQSQDNDFYRSYNTATIAMLDNLTKINILDCRDDAGSVLGISPAPTLTISTSFVAPQSTTVNSFANKPKPKTTVCKEEYVPSTPKPRGRPKGSKNRSAPGMFEGRNS